MGDSSAASDSGALPQAIANNASGQPRTVGVEMEFCGLTLDAIEAILRERCGVGMKRKSDYEGSVDLPGIGPTRVELDAVIFRELKVRRFFEKIQVDKVQKDLGETLEHLLSSEAAKFIPYELVFPPVPVEDLDRLERIRAALAEQAEGTGRSIFNAFGLHLNPELPDLETGTLLAYLRAYLVVESRLMRWHRVDGTRRVLPFIDPFPKDYSRIVLAADYKPDFEGFAKDYLEHNPTRNRPLDFLPVLAEIDNDLVRKHLPEEKISARPTLHYRLPNCEIDDPDWTIGQEWRGWLLVEQFVAEPLTLRRSAKSLLYRLEHPFRAALRRFFSFRWLRIRKDR